MACQRTAALWFSLAASRLLSRKIDWRTSSRRKLTTVPIDLHHRACLLCCLVMQRNGASTVWTVNADELVKLLEVRDLQSKHNMLSVLAASPTELALKRACKHRQHW